MHRAAPDGRYTLQIGSYPVLDEARDQADSLEGAGTQALHAAGDSPWQAVVPALHAAGYKSKEAAEKTGAHYVSQHMIEAYIVAKRVDEKATSE